MQPYPVEDGVNAMSSNQDDYAFAKEALDKAISSGNYDFRRPLKVVSHFLGISFFIKARLIYHLNITNFIYTLIRFQNLLARHSFLKL